MNILIKKAKIIDPNSKHNNQICDILIENGKLIKIAKNITNKKIKTFSKKNLHVSPGWMDIHANFREPGFEFKNDLISGIKSAIKGGFTSVLLMPNTNPVIDNITSAEYIYKRTRNKIIDVHTAASITKGLKGKELSDMRELNSIKCRVFTDDKKSIKTAKLMELALLYSKDFGGLVMNYPNEDDNDIQINEGEISTMIGIKGSPNIYEEIMTNRDLCLAEYTKGNLHLSYISTKESIQLIQKAKQKQQNISADVSINNLVMSDHELINFDSNYKFTPPLRSKPDVKSLIDGLKNNTIDIISSDHCPEDIDNKEIEFNLSNPGSIGLESMFGLIGKHLSHHLSISEIIEKISINPRKIILNQRIKVESNEIANITLFDPDCEWTFSKEDIKSKSKNSPYINHKFKGKALAIYNNKKFKIID
ncbi:MAG: dihydroorotase [Flavobacteriales bacterium]|nr:dihydroorotase [Flavobacteriales bacterium]